MNKCFIPTSVLEELSFEKLWTLKPKELGKIYNNGEYPANRYYKSYGKIPPRDPTSFTYMFSSDGNARKEDIPTIFNKLLGYLNQQLETTYNQIVVNWYETGTQYTPYHKDCLYGMIDNPTVSVVTILENPDMTRELVFKNKQKEKITIECEHGLCVTFSGEILTEWLHGVPKNFNNPSRRISISFRSYN